MSEVQIIFDRDYLPEVLDKAKQTFSRTTDRESKVCDAVSVAWELFLQAPDAPPWSIALYAIRRVKVGRQFRQSVRSIDGKQVCGVEKPTRLDGFDPVELAWIGDNPAELAALRIDFPPFVASLSTRHRVFLTAVLQGHSTNEIAAMVGVSAGRVSQMRRELIEAWQMFVSDI